MNQTDNQPEKIMVKKFSEEDLRSLIYTIAKGEFNILMERMIDIEALLLSLVKNDLRTDVKEYVEESREALIARIESKHKTFLDRLEEKQKALIEEQKNKET